MKTILLQSQSVGSTDQDVDVGDTVEITLHDENGLELTETGVVEEILLDDDDR